MTSSRMLPTLITSPSWSSVAPSPLANAYCQSLPPSAESRSSAPDARASSRAPETKSAWMWVSVTLAMRIPSASAAATYWAISRLGSTMIASPVAAQPIR